MYWPSKSKSMIYNLCLDTFTDIKALRTKQCFFHWADTCKKKKLQKKTLTTFWGSLQNELTFWISTFQMLLYSNKTKCKWDAIRQSNHFTTLGIRLFSWSHTWQKNKNSISCQSPTVALLFSFSTLPHFRIYTQAPLPSCSWDRCFNKTANWCSQCTLLLAAAVWIHGVVQNLLWAARYRETCAIINLLDTQQRWVQPALPGSDWSSRNDKEKRTSGRTSWKDIGASRREHDELGGNKCKYTVFELWSEESES